MLEDLYIQNYFRFLSRIRNCLNNKTQQTWHSPILENVKLTGCNLRVKIPCFLTVSTILLKFLNLSSLLHSQNRLTPFPSIL